MTNVDSPFAAGEEPAGNAGFFVRLFGFPFWPPLWRRAAFAATGEVLAPVLVLAALLNATLGLVNVIGLGSEFRALADAYDASYDPIVWHDGQVDVEGPRIVYATEGAQTFLVDPDATIDIETLQGEFVVIHRHEMIRQKAFGPREQTPHVMVQELIGPGPIRIDSTALHAFWDAYGLQTQAGFFALIAVFGTALDGATTLVYALAAAALVHALRSRQTPFWELFRVAVAASAATLVVGILLKGLGSGLGCCGWVVWPTLVTAATAFSAPPRP